MGAKLEFFSLYRLLTEQSPNYWLFRAQRAAAPNASGPACDFSWALLKAKEQVLLRSACAQFGHVEESLEWVAHFSPLFLERDEPSPLLKLHGGSLSAWWAQTEDGEIALWTAPDERSFWAWLEENEEDQLIAQLKHPAQELQLRFFTEADFSLHEVRAFLLPDLNWMSRAEYLSLSQGGLEQLIQPRAPSPEFSQAERRAAQMSHLLPHLKGLLAEADLRALAFALDELALWEQEQLWFWIELLLKRRSEISSEEWRDIPFALAYALNAAPDQRRIQAQLKGWRGEESGRAEILRELQGLKE